MKNYLKKIFCSVPKEPEITRPHPWEQALCHEPNRYKLSECENEILHNLRNNELDNPAPFSNKTLIPFGSDSAPNFEKPFNFNEVNNGNIEEMMDIPVANIIGIDCTNNLDNYIEGMTFRDVLFKCLHGEGITQESIDFLMGPQSKDLEMPHEYNSVIPKSKSSGGIVMSQYGDWFIVNNGKQRAIIAMYAIWQRYQSAGKILNVKVKRGLL